jgi:hypothetical protein
VRELGVKQHTGDHGQQFNFHIPAYYSFIDFLLFECAPAHLLFIIAYIIFHHLSISIPLTQSGGPEFHIDIMDRMDEMDRMAMRQSAFRGSFFFKKYPFSFVHFARF